MFDKNATMVGVFLWGVNLAAISACTLCYIYLSDYIYRVSGSVPLSELVLLAPMLLPVLFVWQINRISERFSPKNLMIASNLIGLAGCALMFSFLQRAPYLASMGVILIGSVDSVQRVSRIVAVKKYFSVEHVRMTVPLTLTAQFIAGGLAGGLMSVLKQRVTPHHVLLLTALLFGTAAMCGLALPSTRAEAVAGNRAIGPVSAWSQFVSLLSEHQDLRQRFLAFVLLITFFQGFFNVSRVALPAHQLALPVSYVGRLQLVNSGAALLAAVLFYWGSRRSFKFSVGPLRSLSAVFMVGACAGGGVLPSFGSYFLFIFFFELVFFKIQADIVASCPAQSMPLLAATQYAAVYIGMMLAIFFGAFLVDNVGLMWTAILFVVLYFVADGWIQAWLRKASPKLQRPTLP
ncbi:hypothetical protein WL77_12405 [Burkholderia ubonensis]|uniref:hypothetical protein n=1 Tax=Burkholderia ubonensis TaxID=101571 RepID=UPI00075896EE|nr:hypothetical protein [Burkholderia ubonensis]KWE70591.1 hypothetical protein WL77_12405 [Burkholderia ubonensis]KWE74936.1 hypothetical protein WL79_14095 [Burkholderia ubonensis]